MSRKLIFLAVALAGLSVQMQLDKANAQERSGEKLGFFFRGPNAAEDLAVAYKILKQNDPEWLFDAQPRQVSPTCQTRETFFALAICEKIWPEAAWQIEDFRDSFDPISVARGSAGLPNTTVEVFISYDSIMDPKVRTLSDLSQERRREICKNHSWNLMEENTREELLPKGLPPTDCILRVDVPASRSATKKKAATIVLLQPGYQLTLNSSKGRLSGNGKEAAEKVVRDVISGVLARDPSANGKIGPTYGRDEVRAGSTSVDLARLCARDDLESAHKVLRWPSGDFRLLGSFLIVADPGITSTLSFGDPSYNSDFFDQNRSRAGPLSFACKDLLHDQSPADELRIHAMSVASITYGGSVDLKLLNGSTIRLSGLLPPGGGQFVPTAWVTRNQAVTSLPFVLVGSYDNKFHFDSSSMQVMYTAAKDTVKLARGLSIFAASDRDPAKQANFPPYGAIVDADSYPPSDQCDEMPTCLGATPTAMVVAALDGDGSRLLDPKHYRLGSSVVWVTAPGAQMFTAVPSDPGTAKFAVESGSSLAAPAVAAIGLLLQNPRYGSLSAEEAMARIAASADLYTIGERDLITGKLMTNLVRFGRVNATRALEGAAREDDAIWAEGGVSHDPPGYAEIEAPPGLPSRADPSGTKFLCETQQDDTAERGYLRFFKPGEKYFSARPGHNQNPICIGVNDVLRLSNNGRDSGGNPEFTVVFRQDRYGSFNGFIDPRVARGLLLQSDEVGVPEPCAVDGQHQRAGVPACLYKLDPDTRQFVPIDLIGADIMFSALHVASGRNPNPASWKAARNQAWGDH